MAINSAKTYRELVVWQKAMDLAEETYRISRQFPKHEIYGLASQVQRASVSIASNIAEGHARRSRKEFVHHLSYAKGSMAEAETQMILATRLGYIPRDEIKVF
jgi:four helix bundle protein